MHSVDWIEVIINWFPMLLLIGVWLWIMRRMRNGMYPKYQRDYLEQLKRQGETLERIAAAIEKRSG